METDEVAGVAGERLNTTQCCQQAQTIDGELIGVALRNDRVVVRIAALNESTGDFTIGIVDECVTLVKADDNILTVLAQQRLQQRSRLLRQNERCGLIAMNVQNLVANQLMTIRSHDSQALRSEVKIDTIHDGAQFVLRCGEERTVDVLGQYGTFNDNLCGTVADSLGNRVFIGTLDRQ